MNQIKLIRNAENMAGVKVLVRVDFNVPIKDHKVLDDFRIRVALPTISFLRSRGAKIILMSHLEGNDGHNGSLVHVAEHLRHLGVPTLFVKNMKDAHQAVEHKIKNGECILLENLRLNEGEKNNDQAFARKLASLGQVYVNEAFSASHREHASIVGIPKLIPAYAGLHLEQEIKNLSKAFYPPQPFLFILGGAKFDTKLPVLQRFIQLADTVFVAGALANDFFKAKGYEVGQSMISKGTFDFGPFLNNSKLTLPIDVITEDKKTKLSRSVLPTEKIMDAGPATLELLQKEIKRAKMIVWNGPLGMYEGGFVEPTCELAKMIAEAKKNGTETIVGGGDTLAVIAKLKLQDKFSFVSSGGGAMLEFLAKGTLVGIQAMMN